MRIVLTALLGLSLGCSSAPLSLPRQAPLVVKGQVKTPSRPRSTVYRDELERAVAVGLGHFLQRVDLRAATRSDDTGRLQFVGFEILSLRPAAEWLAFDFAPGDIVTKIDGVSVEHYDSVVPMFEGLVKKDRFDVSLLRGGQPKTVVVVIANRAAN